MPFFATGRSDLIALAKSVLMSAGISVWSRLRALGKMAATVIVALLFVELVWGLWGLVSTVLGW